MPADWVIKFALADVLLQCVIECSLCSVPRAADWVIWFAIAPLTALAVVLLQCLFEG